MTKKRRRPIHLHVMVSEAEQALIQERMAEAGIRNMGAYMRKMALSGYVLHVDLSPVRELVSLQRRCSNNLNQVAIQANTYGAIYPEPSAGYIFTWDMLGNGASVAFDQYEGENGTHAEFIEGLCASDMKKTSDDLAIFLKDCV